MKFFVLNQTEEFICDVRVDSAAVVGAKLLVVSYCRDPALPGPAYEYKCQLEPKTPEDVRKYISFISYIQERKKSAIIKVDDTDTLLYALYPEAGGDKASVSCYVKAAKRPAPIPIVASGGTPVAAATTGPKPQAAGGFLSSLLGKVEAKATFRTYNAVETADTTDAVAALEADTRHQLREFSENSSENELSMEPMDKNSRFIVHEIVEEFKDLVSASVGDDDDRHVNIYRKGFEPPDVQLHLSADVLQGAHSVKRKPVGKAVKPSADTAVSSINVYKIESEKRDRRSIEEIQKDMKRRKLHHVDDDTNNKKY